MTLDPAEMTQMRSDMRANVFDHKCTIQRNTGVADPYGHITAAWTTYITDQPCHYWQNEEREITGQNINAVVGDAGLSMDVSVDVNEGDRIQVVVNQLDETIAGVHRILSVISLASHKELELKAENG